MVRRSFVVGVQNMSESGAEQPPLFFFFFPPNNQTRETGNGEEKSKCQSTWSCVCRGVETGQTCKHGMQGSEDGEH